MILGPYSKLQPISSFSPFLPWGKKKILVSNSQFFQNPRLSSLKFGGTKTRMSSEDAKRVKNAKKEEEDDDENDEKSISSVFQNKNKRTLSLKEAKLKKSASNVKKEEDGDESDDDYKPIKRTPNNVKPNSKKESTASAETKKTPISKVKKEETGTANVRKGGKVSEQNGKKKDEKSKGGKGDDSSVKKEKKERKVFDLPGQKREPPEERDPLRIFYESLYKQIPTSEMAAIWMMESGLLAKDVAKKLFEAKRKKAQQQKLGSPMKTVVTVKKQSDLSVSVKKKTTVSTEKKKTPPSKAPSAQSKKRKTVDESSDEGSDDDFIISQKIKKPKVA